MKDRSEFAEAPNSGDCGNATGRRGSGSAMNQPGRPHARCAAPAETRMPECTEASELHNECGWKRGDRTAEANAARNEGRVSRVDGTASKGSTRGKREDIPDAALKTRGKVRGALPRTPGPLSLAQYVPERSSRSRVRGGKSFQTRQRFSSAAHNPRALDRSGPFRKAILISGKGGPRKGSCLQH